jgi:ABC-type transport system involved in multi-copper enzyme maturation permease subunit
MNATIAMRMVGADLLKLRKKLGTVIWSLVLAMGPVLVFFIVRAAQHASNPAEHGPAGGVEGFMDSIRLLAAFFGPLAAIMIGAEAGAGDVASGVFRDLVVTGRSRLALFFTRVPAAIAVTWVVSLAGFALVVAGTFAFASGAETPDASELANGLAFTLFSTGVICIVAVGFAALTASRPATLTVLIGWHLVASPILGSISSLGSSRKLILNQAIYHYSPVRLGDHNEHVTMGGTTAAIVVLGWIVLFLALGAWRTRTMDA